MLSIIHGGNIIFHNLELLCDSEITPEKLSHLSETELLSIGTSTNKAKYIKNVTDEVIPGSLDFKLLEGLDDASVIN